MQGKTISFAIIFTINGNPDPLCSICFFAEPNEQSDANAITHHLVKTVIPKIAAIVPNSDSEMVSSVLQAHIEEMKKELGVECQGMLTDYNLSICANSH